MVLVEGIYRTRRAVWPSGWAAEHPGCTLWEVWGVSGLELGAGGQRTPCSSPRSPVFLAAAQILQTQVGLAALGPGVDAAVGLALHPFLLHRDRDPFCSPLSLSYSLGSFLPARIPFLASVGKATGKRGESAHLWPLIPPPPWEVRACRHGGAGGPAPLWGARAGGPFLVRRRSGVLGLSRGNAAFSEFSHEARPLLRVRSGLGPGHCLCPRGHHHPEGCCWLSPLSSDLEDPALCSSDSPFSCLPVHLSLCSSIHLCVPPFVCLCPPVPLPL